MTFVIADMSIMNVCGALFINFPAILPSWLARGSSQAQAMRVLLLSNPRRQRALQGVSFAFLYSKVP